MNIPLDNLYHWIEGLAPESVVMYLFLPHGSKNISDLNMLRSYSENECWFNPPVICHDQEPLEYNLYRNLSIEDLSDSFVKHPWLDHVRNHCYVTHAADQNLSIMPKIHGSVHDSTIILHSEKNSSEVELYRMNNFIPVYYWAHAVIARDWYRFAQIDTRLKTKQTKDKKFLIYCRDWSNRREYRLKFLELLVSAGLDAHSQVSMFKTCSDNYHYLDHEFKNVNFRLSNPSVLECINENQVSSNESGNYVAQDFVQTAISVVLETEFDGDRIHLTEKTLRAIACGHPFVVAAGPGTLEYLRGYGFKTFDPWVDESYDQETNSIARLNKIVSSLEKINNMTRSEFDEFVTETHKIAEFNQRWFFSEDFAKLVQHELKQNLSQALPQTKHTRGRWYRESRRLARPHPYPDGVDIFTHIRKQKLQWLRRARSTL